MSALATRSSRADLAASGIWCALPAAHDDEGRTRRTAIEIERRNEVAMGV